jgi:hypothetical protein
MGLKVFNSHVKSSQVFYELSVAVSYRELTEVLVLFSLYSPRTDHAQLYCCIRKTTQRTSHMIPSQRLHWCAVA